VICAAEGTYQKWRGHTHHVPSSRGRVAVQVLVAEFGIRDGALGQLGAREVAAEPGLLERFAHRALGVLFLDLGSSEGLIIQPGQGIVERAQEPGGFRDGESGCECLVDLLAEVLDIQMAAGRCSLAAALGRGAMPWSAESAIPDIGESHLVAEEIEEAGQLLVGSESHRLHFGESGPTW